MCSENKSQFFFYKNTLLKLIKIILPTSFVPKAIALVEADSIMAANSELHALIAPTCVYETQPIDESD